MKQALIIVDMQHDFLPGGALGVTDGDQVIAPIKNIDAEGNFAVVFTTADAHPTQTAHFDKWPVHCVVGTDGQKVHPEIAPLGDYHIEKGQGTEDDGYSAFEGVDDTFKRPLADLLREHKITDVTVVGLALDYCVKATALDAAREGFKVTLPLEATKAVAADTGEQAIAELRDAGVTVAEAVA